MRKAFTLVELLVVIAIAKSTLGRTTMKNLLRTLPCALPLLVWLPAYGQGHGLIRISDASFEDNPVGTAIGNPLLPGDIDDGSFFVFEETNVWTIDGGTIVSAENGVVPHHGGQMLRFEQPGDQSDIYQLIDVSHIKIPRIVQYSAWFNALGPHQVQLGVLEYDNDTLPIRVEHDPWARRQLGPHFTLDADPGTWEQISFAFELDPERHFLALGVHSNVTDGVISYADSVRVEPVRNPRNPFASIPEPATSLLAGLGILGILGCRSGRQPTLSAT